MSTPRATALDILVRSEGGTWSAPTSSGYLNEADLQEMLYLQPSLSEGVSVEAIAVRKFSTGVGPADLVIVDGNGSVTVVECKLASNAEIRRTIIGQIFDYAAPADRSTSLTGWALAADRASSRAPTQQDRSAAPRDWRGLE